MKQECVLTLEFFHSITFEIHTTSKKLLTNSTFLYNIKLKLIRLFSYQLDTKWQWDRHETCLIFSLNINEVRMCEYAIFYNGITVESPLSRSLLSRHLCCLSFSAHWQYWCFGQIKAQMKVLFSCWVACLYYY